MFTNFDHAYEYSCLHNNSYMLESKTVYIALSNMHYTKIIAEIKDFMYLHSGWRYMARLTTVSLSNAVCYIREFNCLTF